MSEYLTSPEGAKMLLKTTKNIKPLKRKQMKNIDILRNMTSEEWAGFFEYKGICPYSFGSKRRGRYKTCPYPRHRPFECRLCWTDWLGKRKSVSGNVWKWYIDNTR